MDLHLDILLIRPVKRDLFVDWIKCMLGLAKMSVRRKRAREKKRKPKVDATVSTNYPSSARWLGTEPSYWSPGPFSGPSY
jgi:hypothetical protein